jgi:hypothetical protein
MEMAITAISGPRTMAARAAPTACPVVPPGRGILNIMITKEKAAIKAIKGTLRALMVLRIFLTPITQNGKVTSNITKLVEGLRYPSGICMAEADSHTKRNK